ncbi:lipopolysaccharide biosynthesis protein [Metabacillus sediminilitoris]|uniref:O-unit flippase n=1 Tax=Metabacillus sediminilitoris TaxID=2567941 RepID=A0A4S4BZ73_9BACI|nr:oligosaccharide flippase family protein [Metabacillus sediminilitoris]QGQ47216.1 oligosaccharide flippase family protein [Metabacillus sediminilitoris]THF80560.1 O-unit flippase [Metabacillus sediminilitoris]
MRVRKASLNVLVNFLTIILGFLPSFIVRKAFLVSLGNEFLGLSSLFTNIIGLLSIVELGIGSAIIYSLYKPFAEDNKEKVKGYLNYYSKFYRIVGLFIFILGLLLIPFLDLFIKNEFSILDARLYFILFLIDTVIGYFFSYKLSIINVAQEGYKISIATTLSKLIISILQYTMLMIFPSFYLYILIQISINFLYYLIMNYYINNKYNWIKKTKGFISKEEKESLIKNIKALFLHKIGGVLVLGTDNLIISYYINLTVVGIYNSYYLVIGAFQTIITSALTGVTASVGNLLTEEKTENSYSVHKRLFFLSFWIVSFITISLSNTIKQFVQLWLGEDQILDMLTISVVLVNFYFILMRGSVERFKEGGGIYHQDRYAPLFELVINLVASVILVNVIGLPGVFLGTLLSNILVIFWVKPKMVYKYIFNKKLSEYFKMYFKYLFIGLIPLVITHVVTFPLKETINIYAFATNCIINIIIINFIYLLFFRNNDEFLYFKRLALNVVISKSLRKKLKSIV